MAKEFTKEFTDANFENEVLKSALPVLVDFWAPWCGPCTMVGPIVEVLAEEFAGRAIVGKFNVDTCSAIPLEYEISSIPALFVFKNGEKVGTSIGAKEEKALREFLTKYL